MNKMLYFLTITEDIAKYENIINNTINLKHAGFTIGGIILILGLSYTVLY